MIGPQIILWSFLVVLPVSTFVWSFLLVYPWRYFRQYVVGHIAAVLGYYLLIRLLFRSEATLDDMRPGVWLVIAGYSHCLLGTIAAFIIRKKKLHYV